MDKLVDHTMVKVHAMAYVKQTRQAWSDEDDFPLHKPRMQVQVWLKFNMIGSFKYGQINSYSCNGN